MASGGDSPMISTPTRRSARLHTSSKLSGSDNENVTGKTTTTNGLAEGKVTNRKLDKRMDDKVVVEVCIRVYRLSFVSQPNKIVTLGKH